MAETIRRQAGNVTGDGRMTDGLGLGGPDWPLSVEMELEDDEGGNENLIGSKALQHADTHISVCHRIFPVESSSIQIRLIHRTNACPFGRQAQHQGCWFRIEFEFFRRKEWYIFTNNIQVEQAFSLSLFLDTIIGSHKQAMAYPEI